MTNSTCVYLRLDTFSSRKRDEKKISYANYVALPQELANILFKAVDEGIAKGYCTTNQLEACVLQKWQEISHLYGIHKDNPYTGEYYTNRSLSCIGCQIVWQKWQESNLQLVTRYEHGGYSSGYGVSIYAEGTSRNGVCSYGFLKKVDIFPLFTHELPENAYLVTISKAIRFENNTLYWDNGTGFVSINNPAKTEYNRAFFHQHGVK